MVRNIVELVKAIYDGETTARQTVENALKKAEDAGEFHALLHVTKERALERAAAIDQAVASGEFGGKLAGVPFVVKDNFLSFGAPTTAASKILQTFEAPIQATAVEKLEAEGAICIGKANLDAFAHGGSTENSAYGPTKNAYDRTRVAGGSSGGSAVVTALDVVPFALGTDTGGSIRQPAAFNGVYGMKPTYGAVSRFGVVAMSSGLDTIGCFAKSVRDTKLVMQIMAGADPHDMTSVDGVYRANESQAHDQTYTIGIIKETMSDEVQPEVQAAVTHYAAAMQKKGHVVKEVSLSLLNYAIAMYYVIVSAEVSSNLARYDGVRYGFRHGSAHSLLELYGKTRDEGFERENKRRVMLGSYVLSSGYYDAYYLKAQKARTLLIEQYTELFRDCDFLLSPTTPTTAFILGENTDDPIKMYLSDIMTAPVSLAGLPGLSVPADSDQAGLPIGVQVIGPRGTDSRLLDFVASLEEK